MAVKAFSTGLYNTTDNFLQTLRSCFFIGTINFILLYTGVSPASQIYAYAMKNAITSAELSLAGSVLLINPYFSVYGSNVVNDLGISSYSVFQQWFALLLYDLDYMHPEFQGYYKQALGTMGIQAIIMGMLFQPIVFSSEPIQKILDRYNDSLVRFEMVALQVTPTLLTYFRQEIQTMVRKRYQKVFTYDRLFGERYIFSTMGFNMGFLDHYSSAGSAYIGDDQLKQMLWQNTDVALLQNILQRAQTLSYTPATIQNIIDNTKLYSSTNPIRISTGGIVLANQEAI